MPIATDPEGPRRLPKLSDQPVAYKGLITAGVLMLVGFEVLAWTEAQLVLVLAFVEALLGVFVWRAVTPTSRVEQLVDDAVLAERQRIETSLAALAAAPVKGPRPIAERRSGSG